MSGEPMVLEAVVCQEDMQRAWQRHRSNRRVPVVDGLSIDQTTAPFDRLGMSRLSRPQLLEPPGADPHAGWCGMGSVGYADRPLSRLKFSARSSHNDLVIGLFGTFACIT